jgi:hypothetical protein
VAIDRTSPTTFRSHQESRLAYQGLDVHPSNVGYSDLLQLRYRNAFSRPILIQIMAIRHLLDTPSRYFFAPSCSRASEIQAFA